MNTISFVINIFHLSVITRLESLKGTRYCTILINISLADMIKTLIVGIFHSFYDFFFYNFTAGYHSHNTITVSANYASYHVLLVASIQKQNWPSLG